jgi:hypothetical protein
MTGRLPRCSQHESPGESGGPPSRSAGWSVPITYEDRLVVADTLGTTIKLNFLRARLLGASGLQPAGQVLSPIYRPGRRDVPRDPLGPGLLV